MKRRIFDALRRIDRRLFFPYLSDTEAQRYYRLHEVRHYPFDAASLANVPAAIAAYFEQCTLNWPLEKFHFCYDEGCTIEPLVGWGVTRDNRLIPQSLWNSYVHQASKPSFLKYRLAFRRRLHLDKAISLQYAWGNYWHFHNDILGQLHLADTAGLGSDIPVIVPAGLREMPYFREMLRRSPQLAQRKWVFQDEKTYIVCKEAHFFNTFWDHRENFDAVLDYLGVRGQQGVGNRRIFVGRSRSRGRNIVNMSAIADVLSRYGFETVECDGLSLEQQAALFRDAAYVIGIHGAGLTNMIYRQSRPMELLEIFSTDYLNPCYYWLCRQYGYGYHAILGESSNETGTTTGNFPVDVIAFEHAVRVMLGLETA